MKISLLTDGIYPFVMGGMQKHSYYLAKNLANKGVHIDLYHFVPKETSQFKIENYFDQGELENITFIQVDFPNSIRFPGHYLWNSYRYSVKIFTEMSLRPQSDFIYIQGFTGWKLLSEHQKGESPLTGTNFHGLEPFQRPATFKDWLVKLLLYIPISFCLRRSDYSFSLGGKLTSILEGIVKNADSIMEIPIGVSEVFLGESEKKYGDIRKFVFVGRYERRKGIQELGKAIKDLKDIPFEFEFVGPIKEKHRIKDPRVHYHGLVRSEKRIKKIMEAADVLVVPSYAEGMPTVILEAMATGCAVIATDVGAINNLVNEDTGWLIPVADEAALKEAIIKAVNCDEAELKRKQKNVKELIIQKYRWETIVVQTISAIEETQKHGVAKLSRVALVTDGIYPYVLGGMQKHSYNLAKYFSQNKIFVDLYHFNQSSEYDINKLEFFTPDEKKYINSIVIDYPEPYSFPGHYLYECYQYSKVVYDELMRRPKVDFIYIKGFSGWRLMQDMKRGRDLPPLGINFHGYEMFQKPPSFKVGLQLLMLRPAVRFNIKYASKVLSYGGKITRILRNIGVPKTRILEVPAGIDSNWLTNPNIDKLNDPKNRSFVFVGRAERRKGIEELNIVLRQLLKENKKFTFHFIGPIAKTKRIEASNIIYHNVISNQEEIQKILKTNQILVCPSHSEGMPNVILEGMASNLSVIASNVGAIEYLVSDETGWLIEPNDRSQLYDSMVDAINCKEEVLQEKRKNARKLVEEKFIWKKVITKTINELSASLSS